MESRTVVLALVVMVALVMGVRAVVAVTNGAYGTVARQVGVGGIVLVFGVAHYRRWESLG